jgi:hypothetical protein
MALVKNLATLFSAYRGSRATTSLQCAPAEIRGADRSACDTKTANDGSAGRHFSHGNNRCAGSAGKARPNGSTDTTDQPFTDTRKASRHR